jgi:hypothetical protein
MIPQRLVSEILILQDGEIFVLIDLVIVELSSLNGLNAGLDYFEAQPFSFSFRSDNFHPPIVEAAELVPRSKLDRP